MHMNRHLKLIMTRFRLGISDIAVHYYRYRRFVASELLGPLCREEQEDEIYFVLCCPILNDLRQQLIPYRFFRQPCLFRLTMLLSSENEEIVRNLELYLYRALKIRGLM